MMTLHHLTQFSIQINTGISELLGVTEDLVKLHRSSKVGYERKRLLLKQIKRLIKLAKKMDYYGNTISLNLMVNDLLDEETAE